MVGKAPALSALYNNYLAFGQIVQVWACWCVWFQQEYSYRSAVLDHGVLHLMTLGDATGEEAALANVIVEMFQTPISVEIKRSAKKRQTEKQKKKRRESIKEGNLQLCFLHSRSSSNSFSPVTKWEVYSRALGLFIKIYHRSPPEGAHQQQSRHNSLYRSQTNPGLRQYFQEWGYRYECSSVIIIISSIIHMYRRAVLLPCCCWIRLRQQIGSSFFTAGAPFWWQRAISLIKWVKLMCFYWNNNPQQRAF